MNRRSSAALRALGLASALIGSVAAVAALGPGAGATAVTGCGNNVTWTGAPDGSSSFGGAFQDSVSISVTMAQGGGNSGLAFSNDWSVKANTNDVFTDGFNSTGAVAIYGNPGGNTISITFGANVTDPIVMMNYIDNGAALDAGSNTLTVLDYSNGSGDTATVVGNKISLNGGNGDGEGWAVKISGTFGPSTPLVFTFFDADDTAGMTIVKSGGTGCTPASTTTTVGTTTTTTPPTDYTTNGYFQPVDMNGVRNVGKAGSTIPMKFRVLLGGVPQSSLSVVTSFVVQKVDCSNLSTVTDSIETTTSGATVLRYDTTAQQFIQNWQTPKDRNVCYRVTTTIADGDTLVAYFQLR